MNQYQLKIAKKISQSNWWKPTNGALVIYGNLKFRLRHYSSVDNFKNHVIKLLGKRGKVDVIASELIPDIRDEKTLSQIELFVLGESPKLREIYKERKSVAAKRNKEFSFYHERTQLGLGPISQWREYRIIEPGPWFRDKAGALLFASEYKFK